jgi:hypothetical protein
MSAYYSWDGENRRALERREWDGTARRGQDSRLVRVRILLERILCDIGDLLRTLREPQE